VDALGPEHQGYWNKEEETARAFTADGWLKTGNAGFMDAEGYVSSPIA
jgi:long-chain acyl-CoA synthetase